MQRKLDAKFGCADARVALPAADGTDRRAGDWHRRSHRVRLVTTFPTKHLIFSVLLFSFEVPIFNTGVCLIESEKRLIFSASLSCGNNRAYRLYKFAIRVTNG
jgi:hypothetical protein